MLNPSLADYLVVLSGRWKLIVLIIAFHVALAIAISLILTPVYRSEVIVAAVPEDSSGGLLSTMASQFGSLGELITNPSQNALGKSDLIALLSSKALADQFIVDRNLKSIIFYEKWDIDRQKWNVDRPDAIPSRTDTIRKFRESILNISEARRTTGLVTVSVEWIDPEIAAEWATEYVQFANEKIRQRTISEAQQSIEYLQSEIEKTNIVELKHSIYKLIEAQINRIMIANVREEYAFRVIDTAFVSDRDDEVSPNRLLIVLFGLLMGSFIGVATAVLAAARSQSDRANT